MRGVVRVTCRIVLLFAVPLALAPLRAQTPRQPYSARDTWYEYLLKKCNPSDFDYGAWFEQRRRALLQATLKDAHFWYSLSMTAAALLMTTACAKLMLDNRRQMRVTAEMMADLYNHDLYSRHAAKDAIEKYNQHIEQCNRAMESGESGDGRAGWGGSEVERLRAELQRVATQLEVTTQDRNKLQEELRQKCLIVADLSRRIDALSKRVRGPKGADGGAVEAAGNGPNGDRARLVAQINRLQEELYAERQKNKHLKGV